jgi:thioredoxin 1
MAGALVKVTDANFAAEVEQFKGKVLVDFSASWCPPCRMLAPIIDDLAGEVAGRCKVGSLDVDESPTTAAKFSVMNVPTMIFFKDGKEAARLVGVSPKKKIIEQIDKL